jgi:hypothetical protein
MNSERARSICMRKRRLVSASRSSISCCIPRFAYRARDGSRLRGFQHPGCAASGLGLCPPVNFQNPKVEWKH